MIQITRIKFSFLLSFFFLISNFLSAQQADIHELMQRTDLTIQQVERIADSYFSGVGKGKGSGYKQYQRWLYEQKFHLNADGSFIAPEKEFLAYQDAIRKMPKKGGWRVDKPWTALGPAGWTATSGWNPGVGRLTSVAIHPSLESTIYVTSPGGGIWKSVNSGLNWTPLIDNVNSSWMNLYNICIDPLNTSVLYAGLSSGGIIKSTNAGATWSATGSGPSTIRKVTVHPSNSNIVFAAASNGIYRSVNAGSTWTQVNTNSTQDIEFKPADPNTMYASTSSSVFLRSTDNGVSWTSITLAGSGRTLIAISPNSANTVYVVQASGSLFGRFYRSTDSGLTFTTTITGSPSAGTNFFGYETNGTGTTGQATYDMAICANPANANEVHIAGIICWKSLDGGATFVPETAWSYPNSTGYNHADVHGLEWVNSTIYSVSDGGVYKSTNNGNDWTDLSNGLGIRQFYRIACSKTNANVITGGAQDNGTTMRQSGGNWVEWLGADGMDALISPTNSLIAYGTSQNGSLYKTTNGGNSYTSISEPSTGAWVTPIAMHPTNHDTLFGGWNSVYRSDNGGSSWANISGSTVSSNMSCLTVAPSNPRFIYGAVGTSLYATNNAGATWSTFAAPGTITSICVSPLNPSKIWITTSASSNNVLVSTNMGATFTNISSGLPGIAARSVVVDNSTGEGLYVGMNIGVYYRDNVNTAWIVTGSNLPLVAVNEVELQLATRKLRVGTYGRSVWESEMQPDISIPLCTSLTSPAANATNVAVTAALSWSAVANATGYRLTVGTTSSGAQIMANVDVGNVLTFNPAGDFPLSTLIYVKIVPYSASGSATGCIQQSFTTQAPLPLCNAVTYPAANALSILVTTSLTWSSESNATGYYLNVGTSSGGTQIMNNVNVGNVLTYDPPGDLPYNSDIFVKVVPYNLSGAAASCTEMKFTTQDGPPVCIGLASPAANASAVPINAALSWLAAPAANGYKLSVGTSANGGQILNNVDIGNVLTYDPPGDFTYNTVIYVKIVPYNINGEATGCLEQTFTTQVGPPPCTAVSNPVANASNVVVTTALTWTAAANASGYFLTVGTSSGAGQILNNFDVGNVTTYNPPGDFPFLSQIYVKVVPYNLAGAAIGCIEQSFTTQNAVPTCKMTFTNPQVNLTTMKYRVTLTIANASSATWELGNSNLRFNYPVNTLSAPVIAVNNLIGSGFQYGNPTSTGSNVNTGVISYNFTLPSQTPGKQITNSGFDIFTIEWNIINVNGLTDVANKLQWRNPATSANPKLALVSSTLTVGCPSGCSLLYSSTPDLSPLANLLPACSSLSNPISNAINVPVNTNISWNTSATATGYRLSIGTSAGGNQILNNFNVGNVSSFDPPTDLPPNANIFVKVVPYDAVKTSSFCLEESFTTAPLPPTCTTINSPLNGSVNVQIPSTISWSASASATGYYLDIGTSSSGVDILNHFNVGNVLSYSTSNLTNGTTYFVKVIPYNIGGEASACAEISFQIQSVNLSFGAKVFLYQVNTGTQLMDDQMRGLTNFPLTDPYSTLPPNSRFIHVNNPIPTTINSSVLNVAGNDAIVDWVFLELRTGPANATTVVATKSALLQRDGDIVGPDGISAVQWNGVAVGSYYVAIKHRNHFGFRTLNPVNFTAGTINLNFTNGSVALGGGYNEIEKAPGIWAMVPGDANVDGSIDAIDTIIFEAENGSFDDYNLKSDYNMDASVDAIDSILWELYNGLFEEIE
ncbi:MAG: hypothetical protein ACOYOA_13110 [Saprospiraceae bacterium]